jgi:hypothetical protein
MAVRNEPMRSPQPAARPSTASAGCLASLGIMLLLISVGPLIILLNGGYSILGMGWLADKIGPYGRMFWSVATFFTIDVPIAEKAGLPLAQPVLPWCMVVGITFLEVAIILYKIKGTRAGFWVNAGGVGVSVFDYVTTAAGLVFAPFAAHWGAVWPIWAFIAILIAAPLTFSFEGLLARVLKGR